MSSLNLASPAPKIFFGCPSNEDVSTTKEKLDVDSSKAATSNASSSLFDCPEDLCIRSFVKYGNLLAHLSHGSHKRIAERHTLIDTAKRQYHAKLINGDEKRMLSLCLEENDFHADDYNDLSPVEVGWALPITNPPVRFSQMQKEYLNVSRPSLTKNISICSQLFVRMTFAFLVGQVSTRCR